MSEFKKEFITFATEQMRLPNPEHVKSATETLKNKLSGKVYTLIIYGSCLNTITQSANSTPDYFVVTSNLKKFHSNLLGYVLNKVFSPNIYHFETSDRTFSKYSVSSLNQLINESSPKAKDLFFLGRFSKKMVIAYSCDPETEKSIPGLIFEAMSTVALKCLSLKARYPDLKSFCLACIRLSYLGDTRVESPNKYLKIFEAHEDYYLKCYNLILKDLQKQNMVALDGEKIESKIAYLQKSEQKFIQKSKRRAVYRWPKAMFTAENWLEYVILKIERTQNIQINMTEREKRWWPIYIWKHAFIVWKRKVIK